MFKNRYYNNSKKQITSLFKFSTYNKSSSSSENNNRDKLKKRLTQIRNRILNKEYNDSIKEYSMLKSVIHLKEQRETTRQKRLDETVYNIKNLERNINYTNILKFMDIAFNKDNPFKTYNLKNKIDELENFSKNIYRNKIGIILNKKILHGAKIKSKVDAGNKKELDFDKIYQKIKDSKTNFQKSRIIHKRNPQSKVHYTIRSYKYKNNTDYTWRNTNGKKLNININKSTISDRVINNEIISINNHKKNNTILPRQKSEFNLFNSSNQIRDDKKSLSQNFIFHRNKKVELNDNDNEKIWSKNSSINQSFSSNSYYKPISKMNYTNQIRNKSENRKSNLKPKETMNRTIVNSKSQIKKYTFLIDGLYNDFRKIKSNTNKLLNRYKEWGFSSGKEIDKIIKTKEDMLLFQLEQKCFKNLKLFPKDKKKKRINLSLVDKIKHDFDLIDDDVKRY